MAAGSRPEALIFTTGNMRLFVTTVLAISNYNSYITMALAFVIVRQIVSANVLPMPLPLAQTSNEIPAESEPPTSRWSRRRRSVDGRDCVAGKYWNVQAGSVPQQLVQDGGCCRATLISTWPGQQTRLSARFQVLNARFAHTHLRTLVHTYICTYARKLVNIFSYFNKCWHVNKQTDGCICALEEKEV